MRRKQTERETRVGRKKGVLVCKVYLIRDPAAQNVNIWHHRDEKQQFLLHLKAWTNSTDSTFMTWGSVSFAQRWAVECQSERYFLLLYSEYISDPVLSYFDLSKDIESVLPHLPESFLHKYL